MARHYFEIGACHSRDRTRSPTGRMIKEGPIVNCRNQAITLTIPVNRLGDTELVAGMRVLSGRPRRGSGDWARDSLD
jgi:hypothetical protein